MEKLISKRLKKTFFISTLLAKLPFVKCVILNGSLAGGEHKKSSDIDLLIVAKDGRIFTVRFLVNLFGILFGIKRSKNEQKDHSGKFCFNYFLTETFLIIPTGRGKAVDGYCAKNYSKSIFLSGQKYLFNKFLRVNSSLWEKFGQKPKLLTCRKEKSTSGLLEKALSNKAGDWLEQKLKIYQIRKIERSGKPCGYPKYVQYNDRELRFHPPKIKVNQA